MTNSGLVNRQTYFYQIAAYNSVGTGKKSVEVSATPDDPNKCEYGYYLTPMDSIQSIYGDSLYPSSGDHYILATLRLVNNRSIDVTTNPYSWDLKAQGVTYTHSWDTYSADISYQSVYISAGGDITWQILYEIPTGINNGTISYTGSNSKYVDYNPNILLDPIYLPTAPLNAVALANNRSISLNWNIPLDDKGSPIVGYNIYRGTSANNEGNTPIAYVNHTSYVDMGLENGVAYYYVIAAVNKGIGVRSAEVMCKPIDVNQTFTSPLSAMVLEPSQLPGSWNSMGVGNNGPGILGSNDSITAQYSNIEQGVGITLKLTYYQYSNYSDCIWQRSWLRRMQ